MEYYELPDYGKIFTGKLSPRVLMAIFTSVPKELGFIGTPKFLTKIQGKERQWKGKLAKIGKPRGITRKEYLEGAEYNMAFHSALVATCGEEKALDAYSKLTDRLAVLSYKEFFPSAKDFRGCPDYWETVQEYFLEFLRANDRENTMRFEVLQSTEDEFHAHLTECVMQDIYREAGYQYVAAIVCEANCIFLTNLCNDLGGDFKRECRTCKGDSECDWHFYRQRASN